VQQYIIKNSKGFKLLKLLVKGSFAELCIWQKKKIIFFLVHEEGVDMAKI
jgi:hypothetical protein